MHWEDRRHRREWGVQLLQEAKELIKALEKGKVVPYINTQFEYEIYKDAYKDYVKDYMWNTYHSMERFVAIDCPDTASVLFESLKDLVRPI